MTDSPQEQQQRLHDKKCERQCDYCNNTTALIYCRADNAKLCLSCDLEVHSTNQLFSKHSRSLLCDACDTSPASIFCETEHSVLCHNCDWEQHHSHSQIRCQSHELSSPSSVHNRRPIDGFTGCPSVCELVASFGFDNLGRDQKALFFGGEGDCGDSGEGVFGFQVDDVSGLGDEYSDLFVWDNPAVVSIADLIVSGDSGRSFRALSVPPLPKNRNAACGKHKEEVLRQLRKLAKSEPSSRYGNADVDSVDAFRSLPADQNRDSFLSSEPNLANSLPGYEENWLQLFADGGEISNQAFVSSTISRTNDLLDSLEVPDYKSNVCVVHNNVKDNHEAQSHQCVTSTTVPAFPKVPAYELNSQERDSAISRYKEKRKTRRYDKHIRYESRKARAETRTRIRGRFAKVNR